MKVVIGLMVVGGLVLFLVFQFGVSGMNTAEQARQFRSNINEDMTWDQVADVREPRKYVRISPASKTGEGHPIDFSRENVAKVVKNQEMAHGFIFRYTFDPENIWNVRFDSQGNVTSIGKPRLTTKGLLEGEAFKR